MRSGRPPWCSHGHSQAAFTAGPEHSKPGPRSPFPHQTCGCTSRLTFWQLCSAVLPAPGPGGGWAAAGGDRGSSGPGFQVKAVLDDILERIPETFNIAEIMAKAAEKTPYVVVAFQECERMNILTHEMRRSLKELNLGLKVKKDAGQPGPGATWEAGWTEPRPRCSLLQSCGCPRQATGHLGCTPAGSAGSAKGICRGTTQTHTPCQTTFP